MKKITLILTSLFIITGCNKLLDEIPDAQVRIDTPEKVGKLLVYAYPQVSASLLNELSSDNIGDGGSLITYSNFLSEEVAYWRPAQEYFDYEGLRNVWQYHYQAINHANTALEAIEKLGNTSELQAAKGEALVARAYAHFELANLFCKPYHPTESATDLGISYKTEPEKELNNLQPRGTLAQVYQQIDADLTQGLPLINDSFYEQPKYHFNKKAAYAFAARFYLYYQQWQKAIDAANEVLTTNNNTTLSLLRKWEDFRDVNKAGSTKQGSRALYYTREDIPANLLLLPVFSQITNYISEDYSRRYTHNSRIANQETVATKNLWDPEGKTGSNNFGYEFFWFMPIKTSSNENDIVFFDKWPIFSGDYSRSVMVPFTTDETLLVRAEAKILLGGDANYQSALEDINMWTSKFIQVKTISGYTNRNTINDLQTVYDFYNNINYSEATNTGATQKKRLSPSFTLLNDGKQEPLLHYLLQCRRILTLGDGLRWQDVRRYNIEVVRYETDNINRNLFTVKTTLPPSDLRRTLQLPAMVIQAGTTPNPR